MNSDFYIENLPHCPDSEYFGGITTRIWYALVDDFSKISIVQGGDFEDFKIVDKENITLYGQKELKHIDVFLEQNAITEKTQGATRRQKLITEFRFLILGFTARNLGFVSKLRNRALIFIIPDNNGNIWIFGNKKNAAYLTDAASRTEQKIDDDSVVELTYSSNSELMLYDGNIEDIRVIGGFSSGFSKGFRV